LGIDFSNESLESPQSDAIFQETNTVAESNSDSHESLNDILSATIAKLQKRQEAIAKDTDSKSSQEEDIKAQIAKLQEQVKELEADMKQLDTESKKITSNIEELEGMKLDPVKEHNANRSTKK
jgi:peptidoglycan hydrolase CwlO-like protein